MGNSLKDLKNTYRRRDILLPTIERHVLKQAQEPSDRRSDILHPSEMAKSSWCGRHDFYRMTGVTQNYKGRAPSFRLENIFDYGHSIHSKYQRWLTELGIMWGKWVCKSCKSEWTGESSSGCPECGSTRIRYKEVSLEHPELMIAGHSDGVVDLGGKNYMIEIKTVGLGTLRFEAYQLFDQYQSENLSLDELWFHIKRPFATHIRQGQIYLHIAQTAYPELNIDEIIFIYEWKPTQEVKEFVVKYNPDLISKILETAAEVAKSIREGTTPTRPDWADVEGKTCKSCEYRNTCWGENNDSAESTTSKPALRVRRSSAEKRRRTLRS